MEVENIYSLSVEDDKHKKDRPFDGLRVRVKLPNDKTSETKYIPWAFPLLPKIFQSIPKVGEAALVLSSNGNEGQRYYIGPIISQPQYNTYAAKDNGLSLFKEGKMNPLERVSNNSSTIGAFPKSSDVAIVGRGAEDVILRMNDGSTELTDTVNSSEIQLRAGIRGATTNDSNPNMIGNIIFNEVDPAYIQLKYKKNLCGGLDANSIINIVADKINLISNKDKNVSFEIHDKNMLIKDDNIKDVTLSLQAVPLGNNLYDLLMLMRNCILYHVHPFNGMQQCGDNGGHIDKLLNFDWSTILSKHVRTS